MRSVIMITHWLMIPMYKVVTRKIEEDKSNMCKNIVIETELMQLHMNYAIWIMSPFKVMPLPPSPRFLLSFRSNIR